MGKIGHAILENTTFNFANTMLLNLINRQTLLSQHNQTIQFIFLSKNLLARVSAISPSIVYYQRWVCINSLSLFLKDLLSFWDSRPRLDVYYERCSIHGRVCMIYGPNSKPGWIVFKANEASDSTANLYSEP